MCGANWGARSAYETVARELGRALATNGIEVVYGGAAIGLMGVVADAALDAGGTVIGVVPVQLPDGKVHGGLTQVHFVPGMHERKALMAALSEAFVVLPGGLGTLDEMFEALTWAQLGIHSKPLVVLDVHGYFDALMSFLRQAVTQGFILRPIADVLVVETDVNSVVSRLSELLPGACSAPEEPFPRNASVDQSEMERR